MSRPRRNLRSLVDKSWDAIDRASERGVMHQVMTSRSGHQVTLKNGEPVVEFISCSYLGLDTHPDVVAGAKQALDDWAVHHCCARSRFTIGINAELEERLSALFGAKAITFPSVTSAHMSTLPLVAAGEIPGTPDGRDRVLVFDRFAHASMQYLRPVLEEYAETRVVPHNDMEALEREVRSIHEGGRKAVYLADGVYSMGGVCPLEELLPLSERLGFDLYIDDAHGTSIFGPRGVGYALEATGGELPPHMILTYSLAKGFGCNGGGVLLPDERSETFVRRYGQVYIFSTPLDFAIVGGALASVGLHEDGTVDELQGQLRRRLGLFDERAQLEPLPFSPIRMIPFDDTDAAILAGERLIEAGYFISVAMFPVVPRNKPQHRICITADHTEEEILGLADALRRVRPAAA